MASDLNIDWKWVGVSVLIFIAAHIVLGISFFILKVATLGVGGILFLILKPAVYFVGGFFTGYFSPGITIKEPAIGAVIVTILGTIFDIFSRSTSLFWMIVSGALAFFCALYGAKLGEKKQSSK